MKKYIIVITTFFFISTVCLAEAAYKAEGHHIGFGGGMTTGNGLMYRYYPQNWGIQGAFLPIVSPEDTFISSGVTGFRTLFIDTHTKLFIYTACSAAYVSFKADETDEGKKGRRIYVDVNTGAGPGFDIYIFDHITLSIMGGYGLYNRFEDDNYTPTINFTVEGSVLYRW